MTDALDWNEDQWSAVNKAVHDEALRARVAASFLPLYGPLPADTQSVPLNKLSLVDNSSGASKERLDVNDYDTLRLTTVSVNVYLKGAQVADPELAAAQIMFRRAAAVVARVEDDIIFNGQPVPDKPPNTLAARAPHCRRSIRSAAVANIRDCLKRAKAKPIPRPKRAIPEPMFSRPSSRASARWKRMAIWAPMPV